MARRTRFLAEIAIKQARMDFSGSALKEPYLRKVTIPELSKLNLTVGCQEYKEAYALALNALGRKEGGKKEKKGFLGFLKSLFPSSPKTALF